MVNLSVYLAKLGKSLFKIISFLENPYTNLFIILVIILNLKIFHINFNSKLNEIDNQRYYSLKLNKSNLLFESPFEEYILIHESNIEGTFNKPRKIVFNGHTGAGYANKLYSMLSAFTIAILTDSAFICEWNRIYKYIKPNFFLMFYKFRKNNELNSNYDTKSIYVFNTTNSSWSGQKSIRMIYNQTIPLYIKDQYDQLVKINRYKYNRIEPLFFELCSNPIYYSKLLKYDLVKKSTVKKAIKLVKKLEQHKNYTKIPQNIEFEVQDGLFQIGYEVAGNLLNKYWKPVDRIQNLIDYYLSNEFKSFYVIGIQIRTEFLNSIKEVDKFIDCAQSIESNLNKTIGKQIKWYMTSDSQQVIDKAIEFYGNKVITGQGTIAHVESNKGYDRAILDIELLSLSDELILTAGSTFGKIFFQS